MATYYADYHGNSRLYDGDWSNGTADNGSKTGVTIGDEKVLCVQVTEYGCNKSTTSQTFKLQFSKDGGSFTDVTAATEISWGTGTSLVDGASGTAKVSANPSACSGGTLGWTYENEGDNLTGSYSLASGDFGELQWALDTTNATAGSTYTFRVVNVTDSNTVLQGSISSSITMAAAPTNLVIAPDPYHVLDDNDASAITITQVVPPVNLSIDPTPYHLLDDNDGNPVTITETVPPVNLVLGADPYHVMDNDPVSLTQDHSLAVDEASHLDVVDPDPMALTQTHVLTVAPSDHLQAADSADLTATVTLDVAEAFHLHDGDPVVVVQVYSLTVQPAEHLHEGETHALTQDHALAVQEADSLNVADNIGLFDIYANEVLVDTGTLTGGNLASTYADDANVFEVTEVTGAPGFDVQFTFWHVPTAFTPVWFDLHGYYSGNPAHQVYVQAWNYTTLDWDNLTAVNDMPSRANESHYAWQLTDEANQISSGGEVTLRIVHDSNGSAGHHLYIDRLYLAMDGDLTLVLEDGDHLHVADNLNLGGAATLDSLDADHLHVPDNVDLTQDHTLVVAPADHIHVGDAPEITQDHSISVAEAFHLHAGDAPAITQDHALDVAECFHLHDADNVELLGAGSLAVEASDHVHAADPISLTQDHQLAVEEAASEHTADQVSMSGVIGLTVSGADHLHAADNIGLVTVIGLAMAEASHVLSDDAPLTLASAIVLGAAAADHTIFSDNVALTQEHTLSVNDGTNTHYGEEPALVVTGDSLLPSVIEIMAYRSASTQYGFKSIGPERRILSA